MLQRAPVTPSACSSLRGIKLLRYTGCRACLKCNSSSQRRSRPCAAASSDVSAGIFPAGKKQAKVRIPALHVNLTTQYILSADVADSVDHCLSAGTTAIIVRDASASGADLFKAAAKVKEVVRGRVPVLLEDRTDIVAATQVDGVVLTERGMSPSARMLVPVPVIRLCFMPFLIL